MLRRMNTTITTVIFWLFFSSIVLAQLRSAKSPFNPLQSGAPDILLPQSKTPRPLTSEEQQKLAAGLDELDTQAQARLDAGDPVAAFDFWNRELRLRQVLGPLAEIAALQQVGAIAWSQGQSKEVQVITQRLQVLQQQANVSSVDDVTLWQALGQSYQQLRAPQQAIQVYQRILDIQRRQKQDITVQAETLKTIAELHLSWFEYPQAAATYEEVLSIDKSQGDRLNQKADLQQLVYIYQQANQRQKAVAIQQQLAEFYLNNNDVGQLPRLRLAIAANYASLNQTEAAFQNYQEAYASAWGLEQYNLAAEALQKLIMFYRSQGQIDSALQAGQILLQAQERANDDYGRMNAYDQIGQLFLKKGNYTEARVAFQNGLDLAKQLHYQEKYFATQLMQATGRNTK